MLAALLSTALLGLCPAAQLSPSQSNIYQVERSTVCLINQLRKSKRLKPLAYNRKLSKQARIYSLQMTSQHFFAHFDPSGKGIDSRLKSSGYLRGADLWLAGENLAWKAGSQVNALEIVRSWVESPHHLQNMLRRNFTAIGVGVSPSSPFSSPGATYSSIMAMKIRPGR